MATYRKRVTLYDTIGNGDTMPRLDRCGYWRANIWDITTHEEVGWRWFGTSDRWSMWCELQ